MRAATLSLRHRAARDPRRAGGKGAGLARLQALGFSVPPGFVISTSVFTQAVEHLRATARSPADGLATGDLPADFVRRLLAGARKLQAPYAVRSSLVGEDSNHASMAGQLVTLLDVRDEAALVEAVKRCYASAFSPRLEIYRQHIGGGKKQASGAAARKLATCTPMAVVVQRMQPFQVAGVAFSADPITGQRCVIVEAAAGKPGDVVGGRVNPARWRIDARGVVIESAAAESALASLSSDTILQLAASVRRIAGQLVDPVDVEWLWDGDRFWFLQARPITTLTGQHVYSSRLVADMSPGLIKPLLWSTNSLGMARNVFGRIFGELLGPTGIDYGTLIKRINSRLYADTTLLGELLVRLGMPANFFEVMARDERAERPRFRPSPRQLLRLRRVLPFLRRQLYAKGAIRDHIRRQDAELDRYRKRDWQGSRLPELQAEIHKLRELHGRSQWFIFLVAFNAMVRKRILDRMVRRHAPGVDPADLIRGLAGLKALEPNRRLQELGTIARDLTETEIRMLKDGNSDGVEATLRDSESGRRLLAGFDSFMLDYGFLSANGTDISAESWVERPELVWQIVAENTGPIHAPPTAKTTQIRREARAQVRNRLHAVQRRPFAWILRSAMTYLHLRERVSLLHSEDAYQMRRVFLALGRGLVQEQALRSPEDVFYLYVDELAKCVEGKLPAMQVRDLVERRRSRMAADAEISPPDTICGDTPVAPGPVSALPWEHLAGIGGSSGWVEGRARIVHDPLAAPSDLGPDDILVVPFTDVGWTPLFAKIAGIVAETGGQLSHSAIIAREYNLPAVVSVPDATRRLCEYQSITVDGLSGRIYLGHVIQDKENLT